MLNNSFLNERSHKIEQKGENLFRQAEESRIQAEQEAAIAEEFNSALQAELEAKQNQVEDIEDRLDLLIKNQETRLLQLENTQPGFLSRPGKRPEWRKNFDKQQDLLRRLQTRREMIREIKDGIGVHSNKIEDLAYKKLRFNNPKLVSKFEEMREAARKHELLLKEKKKREQKQKKSANLGFKLKISKSPR